MEITLNSSHFITIAILLIVLAMLMYAFILIKAILHHLKSIQARTKTAQKRLEKTKEHLTAADADMVSIREALGLADRPAAASPEHGEADISLRLTEFKNALSLLKQHVGKR